MNPGLRNFRGGGNIISGEVNFFGRGDIFSGGVGNFLGGQVEIFSGAVSGVKEGGLIKKYSGVLIIIQWL